MDRNRGRPRAPGHLDALRRAFIENAARRDAGRAADKTAFSLAAAVAAGSLRASGAGHDVKNKAG